MSTSLVSPNEVASTNTACELNVMPAPALSLDIASLQITEEPVESRNGS